MKILLLDIETSPNTAYVWSLYKENIPLARLIESSETLCWAAKWYGSKDVMYDSIYESSHRKMIKGIHKLLDEANVIVHYYGTSFDIPTLNKEFLIYGLTPPAPSKQVDLCKLVKDSFKFPSNKLDYVAQRLGLGQKHDTEFQMWVDCMARKPEAWRKMKAYNIQDVRLLEKVYDRLKPWIKGHANYSVYSGKECCPNCGSVELKRRGFYYTASSRYPRFVCDSCGKWSRGNRTDLPRGSNKTIGI